MTLHGKTRRFATLPVVAFLCLGQPGLPCAVHCLIFGRMASAMTSAVSPQPAARPGARGMPRMAQAEGRDPTSGHGGAHSFCHPDDASQPGAPAHLRHRNPMTVAPHAGVDFLAGIFDASAPAFREPSEDLPSPPRGPPPRA